MHRAYAHAELFGGLLLLHAAQHQLDCPSPGLQWDDGFGHMASIPGIHRQPTLQALPGRITQMLHHLGRRHRRGEIQLHRTLSFLKTEHTKIFPFGLQENVRSPHPTEVHVASDSESTVVEIHLSPGDEHDAAHGRRSMAALGASMGAHPLMGRAYERDSTRLPAESFGLAPVVPPKRNRTAPWDYDRKRTRGGTWSNASSTA